ncbi:MAG: carotenoid 1,2-hydratase [Deltaproteobacteria bacterium]|nr:carotenoid 1,2-hydratase [Deltaproteobacteria bacterium]
MIKRYFRPAGLICIYVVVGAVFLWGSGTIFGGEYLSVEGPCDFAFPADHGAHPGYQTEWWYYTGNLYAEGGRPFGVQLTIFRRQLIPPGAEKGWPSHPSSWRAKNLFLAHIALSDVEGGRFYWDEDVAREAVGLGGVAETGDAIEVFLGRWKSMMTPSGHHLTATTDTFSFDLTCTPRKAPTAHGRGGYSQKGLGPESASCYYSLTRLEASGDLFVNGRTYKVKGSAWMDHEYSTAPLEPTLAGWDWFSLQLSDKTELMLYILREKDGSWNPASSGTFVPSTGAPQHLSRDDFRVEVMDRWRSPHSGGDYPCQWRIRVFPLQLDLEISPRMEDQELRLTRSMRVSYWEGCVTIRGRKGRGAVEGAGYVELTGYATPFDLLGQEKR